MVAQLYRGAKGGAGELGHTMIAHQAQDNANSQYISLEDMAADPALFNGQSTIEAVTQQAQAGNQAIQNKLQQSGAILGIGLANVINILSPELVIVSGEGVEAGDYRIQPMLESMKQHTFQGLLDDVDVIVIPTGDQEWARGAANIVISKVFASPIVDAQVEA